MKSLNKLFGVLLALAFVIIQPISVYAATADNLSAGTYSISASLSCYVSAMGGVEFGGSLLKSAQLVVDKNGNKKITLNLSKSSVTIYSVTCDTFIDASPSGTSQETDSKITNGTIGYYDKNGRLQTSGVTHTLSRDTALNSQNDAVKYVDSITFPIDSISATYKLTLFVNSNVMGMQFDPATLTVDWDSVHSSGNSNNASTTKSDSTAKTTSKNNSADNQNINGTLQDSSNNNTNTSVSSSNTQTSDSVNEKQNNSDSQTVNEDDSVEPSDNVIKKDGLNIHYVNDDSKLDFGTSDYANIPFYVYLNMPVLIGMVIFAGAFVIAGIILLFVSKKQKEKKRNEQNS